MPEFTKNDILPLKIEGYSSDGQGVARHGGRVVFVRGALVGETVSARILKVMKTAAFARTEQILEASPHRVTPVCPHFGKCGGCGLMHMSYEEELRYKHSRVTDALRKIGGTDVFVPPVVPSPETLRYRNKVIFEVSRGKDGRAITGFYRARSHDIVSVGDCPLQSMLSERASDAVREWADTTGAKSVRNLFLRTGELSAQAVIVAAQKPPKPELLISLLKERCPELTGISFCLNRSGGNVALDGEFSVLWGDEFFTDILCGYTFNISPSAFYQINRRQAERIYGDVCQYAEMSGADTALDLYCGAGTITLSLSRAVRFVYGAEIVPAAAENARHNAALNGVSNAEFICGDSGGAAGELSKRGVSPDVIVVDPPRKGLAAETVSVIADSARRNIIYISCDPATLARDIRLFADLGWNAVSAAAYDMFPRCAHAEAVVLLEKDV